MIHLNAYEATTYQSLTLAEASELQNYTNRYPTLWIKTAESTPELARQLNLDIRLLETTIPGMFTYQHTAVVVIPERTTMLITPRLVLTIGQPIDLPADAIPQSSAHLAMLLLSALTGELAGEYETLRRDLLGLRQGNPTPPQILALQDRIREALGIAQQLTDDFAQYKSHPLFEKATLEATLLLQQMRAVSYQLTVLNYWQVDDLWKVAQSQPAQAGFTRNDMIFAGLFILAILVAALT
ncbi:MAG: hypothetical protein L0154_29815 [Chloroflexi bacterium]|nr:hypothetical protein [Chloroflexota bacterium]